jgi:acylphosphatase
VRKRVIVYGNVQGVGFRVAVQQVARSRGVAGWVRNRPDGSVEALFDGDPEAVDAVVRFCADGPRLAQVERVEVSDADAAEEPSPGHEFVVH